MSKAGIVGAFVMVGIAVMILLSMQVDDEGHIFQSSGRNIYYCELEEIESVSVGSIVRLANTGIRIGRVEEIKLAKKEGEHIFRLKLSIKEIAGDLPIVIRKDSDVTLQMITILQGMYLAVSAGTPGSPPLKNGETILTGTSTNFMDSLSSIGDTLSGLGDGGLGRMLLGEDGYKDIQGVTKRLDADAGLGKWLLGEEAQKDIAPTMADLRKTLANFEEGSRTESKSALGRILHSEDMGKNLESSVADLSEAVESLKDGTSKESNGTVARILHDEEMGKTLDDIVADVRDVTKDLAGNESTLAKLISDEQMGKEIASTFTDISSFANDLTTGEGTISQLINDPTLYVEAKRLVSQATEAVEDAREAAPISAFTSILFGAVQ